MIIVTLISFSSWRYYLIKIKAKLQKSTIKNINAFNYKLNFILICPRHSSQIFINFNIQSIRDEKLRF